MALLCARAARRKRSFPYRRGNLTLAGDRPQALRLWHGSGLDDAAFVAQLHAARQRVRTYQGKQGTGTIANKMGYYFRCVSDLVGCRRSWGRGGRAKAPTPPAPICVSTRRL